MPSCTESGLLCAGLLPRMRPRVGWGWGWDGMEQGRGDCPGCGMQEETRPAWMEVCSSHGWGQGGLWEQGADPAAFPAPLLFEQYPAGPHAGANFNPGARPNRPELSSLRCIPAISLHKQGPRASPAGSAGSGTLPRVPSRWTGQDLPFSGCFGLLGAPTTHSIGVLGSWLEWGMLAPWDAGAALFSTDISGKEVGGFFSTDNFIEKALGLGFFFPFLLFFSPFSQTTKRCPRPLCFYLKSDW